MSKLSSGTGGVPGIKKGTKKKKGGQSQMHRPANHQMPDLNPYYNHLSDLPTENLIDPAHYDEPH